MNKSDFWKMVDELSPGGLIQDGPTPIKAEREPGRYTQGYDAAMSACIHKINEALANADYWRERAERAEQDQKRYLLATEIGVLAVRSWPVAPVGKVEWDSALDHYAIANAARAQGEA